jgi:hypothetical protein
VDVAVVPLSHFDFLRRPAADVLVPAEEKELGVVVTDTAYLEHPATALGVVAESRRLVQPEVGGNDAVETFLVPLNVRKRGEQGLREHVRDESRRSCNQSHPHRVQPQLCGGVELT